MAGPFRTLGRVFSSIGDAADAVSKTAYAAQEAADGLISLAARYAVEQKHSDRTELNKLSKEALKDYDERMEKAKLRFLEK